jgi:hypothetical protein
MLYSSRIFEFFILFSNIRTTLCSRRKYQLSFVGIRQEEFEDTKGIIKSRNRRRTYNTMVKRKETKRQTMAYNMLQ